MAEFSAAAADLTGVARLALEQWDLNPVAIAEVSRSENIVFRVEAADGVFVLRMHRPGYHSYEELVSEQLWTRALAEAGIDVPVPRATKAGDPYGRIDVLGGHRHVGVLEWVEGTTMGELMAAHPDAAYAEGRFAQLGRLLAALHDQACTWRPPPTFSRGAVDAAGLVGEAPAWGRFWEASILTRAEQERFASYRERLYRILCGLPTWSDPTTFSMIHADLHPNNVVVNGTRLHVIDFDDASYGWHAYDLAVALKNYQKHDQFDRYQAAVIAGYREVRDVAEETVALIPLFLLVRALITVGWADARPELGAQDYGRQLARDADAVAEAVLARYA